jgi:hypothetical protein
MAKIKHRESVLIAIHEFETLGRDRFLERYGFGRSRTCFRSMRGRSTTRRQSLGLPSDLKSPPLVLRNGRSLTAGTRRSNGGWRS